MKLETPDITKAQAAAYLGAAVAFGDGFGICSFGPRQRASAIAGLALVGTVYAGDTLLRIARAKHLGARVVQDAPLRDSADDGPQDVPGDLVEDDGVTHDALTPDESQDPEDPEEAES